MPVLLDVESRSRADLKKVGGRKYWEHPSSEILCAVIYDTDTGDVETWRRGDAPPHFASIPVAHNSMGFDRFAAARVWGYAGAWLDSSELARKAGLPGALDALGTRWLGLPKDKVASKFTASLSTVRRPSGKKNPNAIAPEIWKTLTPRDKRERGVMRDVTPEDLARVERYCISDVEIMAHGWEMLAPWIEIDAATSKVERVINDRGIGFDSQLATRLLECDAENAWRACEAAARTLGWTPETVLEVANSPQQFVAHTGMSDATAETVEDILVNQRGGATAVALATARRALASIARGKLEAGLARVSDDGRLRDMHRYYGAHTGRWSGRGMQLQNIPRPDKRFEKWGDAEICKFADDVIAGRHADGDEIDLLLRACLVAKPGHTFAVCDFSGVEARALAWCANDYKALEVFASGRDPYKVAAATIFGCAYEDIGKDERRQVGKVAELACGYGMGASKFEWTALKAGSDLASMGIDPQDVIDAWRRLHAPIVRFWYEVEDAWAKAVEGRAGRVDCFDFVPAEDGSGIAVFLPSGRPIVYNEARVSYEPSPVFGKPRRALSYLGTKQVREHIYGGKITENLIQALCRDLLADAMVRAEDAGLCPVLHVHDELVCEVPASVAAEAYEYLHGIMTDLPEWATGFPIGAAGHHGRRYRK